MGGRGVLGGKRYLYEAALREIDIVEENLSLVSLFILPGSGGRTIF